MEILFGRDDWEWESPFQISKISSAFIASIVIHSSVLAAAVYFSPDKPLPDAILNPAISLTLVRTPVAANPAKFPARNGPTLEEIVSAPAARLARSHQIAPSKMAEPKPLDIAKATKEAVEAASATTPVVSDSQSEAEIRIESQIFDPVLRKKFARVAAEREKSNPSEVNTLRSYTTSHGSLFVDLGDERCLEVRDELLFPHERIWWSRPCL